MTEELQFAADLRDVSFASACGRLMRQHATGVLEVHDAVGTSRAFFLDGVPQGAKLSRLKNPIGRIVLDQGLVSQANLDKALSEHNKTDKLLGQVLLELELIDEEGLRRVMSTQSRLNYLHLFSVRDGRINFEEGLVHLTDFSPAPVQPLSALYEGVRDYAREDVTYPLLAKLAFSAVSLSCQPNDQAENLPPAEQMALELLQSPRCTGDLARRVPLPSKALGALLFALNELEMLDVAPAVGAEL